jgi:osmotically-inducible protein OsmY
MESLWRVYGDCGGRVESERADHMSVAYATGKGGKKMAVTEAKRADIRRDIIEEMEYDPAVTVHDIAVVVENGVVTLSGVADSYGTRQAAEDAALRVIGVRQVFNNIIVDPQLLGVPTDSEIANDVRNRIDRDILVPKGKVTVSVSDGIVTLTGSVPWQFQRAAAGDEARGARGVRLVNNMMALEQARVVPGDIEDSIRKALVRNAQVDADHIRVSVNGAHVTLTGTARSWAERTEAEDAAWRARGVVDVTDQIAVQPV